MSSRLFIRAYLAISGEILVASLFPAKCREISVRGFETGVVQSKVFFVCTGNKSTVEPLTDPQIRKSLSSFALHTHDAHSSPSRNLGASPLPPALPHGARRRCKAARVHDNLLGSRTWSLLPFHMSGDLLDTNPRRHPRSSTLRGYDNLATS